MILVIKPLIYERLKPDLVKLHVLELGKDGGISRGYGRHKFSQYDKEGELDLSSLTRKETEHLLDLLQTCNVHGCQVAAADVRKYLRASDEGVENVRARTCRQAAWMLEHYFSNLPHHTLFSKDEYGGHSHSGYYVGDVDYEPEKPGNRDRSRVEEYTQVDLWWVEDDVRHSTHITLHRGDCLEKTCQEMLHDAGYVPETAKLMDKLRSETERFYKDRERVGVQFVATGIGLCDLDNALVGEKRPRYWGSEEVRLDRFGEAQVVIDVLQEKDEEKNSRSSRSGGYPDPYRWHKWNSRFHSPGEDEIIKHLEADENTAEPCDVDIPVHPLVPCFDLRRHTRLRVHVNNLKEYVYHKEVAERLVLPDRDWQMVNLLVDHSANVFEDIVSGKGRSMNILAVGPPGTGKTATAEVFSEFKGRPLYTVQCSQLGMDAEQVEKNLAIIMARADRWNAVLLLDEADVYISKRGTDLNQNAIVGAFLRVLEYASCILFMTTNLGDEVDDAITSRCIAKLTYDSPGQEAQAKIWKILADLNNLKISPSEIDKVVHKHPNLTGRDVKNLLKLASFVVQQNGKVLDAKAIEYALQFKPTQDFFKEEE